MEGNLDQFAEHKESIEKELFVIESVAVRFNRSWPSQFPNKAGIYIIYDKGKKVYVGETGNIQARMKDLRRTLNHSFRRSLGFKLFDEKATSRKKFSEENEQNLNDYFEKHITVGWLPISFGRLEMEEHLVRKYKGDLLNKKEKRK